MKNSFIKFSLPLFMSCAVTSVLFTSQQENQEQNPQKKMSVSPSTEETTPALSPSSDWRMPEVPQLNPEQHVHVESQLRQVTVRHREELFNLLQHHIFAQNQSTSTPQHIICDIDKLTNKIAGQSEATLSLFLECVKQVNAKLQIHNQTASSKYKELPMDTWFLGCLMDALTQFPEHEQEKVVQQATKLFATTDNNGSLHVLLSKILESLHSIPFEKRESVLDVAMHLQIKNSHLQEALQILDSVPQEALEPIKDYFLQLDREYSILDAGGSSYIISLIKCIIKLSVSERETLIENVRPFIDFVNQDKNLDRSQLIQERQRLLATIGTLPEENLKELIDEIAALRLKVCTMCPAEQFFDGSAYTSLVKILGEVPQDRRSSIIENALKVIEGSQWEKNKSFSILLECTISNLIQKINTCMRHNSHWLEYAEEILSMTNNRTLQARLVILDQLSRLLPDHNDMVMGPVVRHIAGTLPYLLADDDGIHATNRAIENILDFYTTDIDFEQLRPFLELPLPHKDRNIIIDTLTQMTLPQHRAEGYFVYVDPADRDDFYAEALRLCKLPIDQPNYEKLIEGLAATPATNRHNVVQQLINLNKKTYTQEEIVEALGLYWFGLQRIWLDAQGNVPAGLDVHHRDRDQKMTDALRLLVKKQEHISTKDLEKEFADCKEYIMQGNFSESQKKRALCALEGEKVTHGWGPLRSQMPSHAFANLDGLGLIGHLWRFANTYVDPQIPNDTENARRAFVMACVDSADEDGWMVCNLGKVQRIVCSVLQGRLPGAVIDEEAKAEENEVAQVPHLTGQQLAALYLQTLQNNENIPTTEEDMCKAAADWLADQPLEVDDEMKRIFFKDIKTFFAYRG